MRVILASLVVCAIAPAQQGPAREPAAVFRSGTRLVEVEVVVRGPQVSPPGVHGALLDAFASGSPFGPAGPMISNLTKADFTLLDNGAPREIAVFRSDSFSGQKSDPGAPRAESSTLAPGTVSNRIDNLGEPINGATAVLIDQLNTHFDLKAYERSGVTKLLRSLTESDRIALYALGAQLHLVQGFTTDPKKLVDAVAKLDPGRDLVPARLEDILQDYPPGSEPDADCAKKIVCREVEVNADIHNQTTIGALTLVVRDLARVRGRKNLIWLMDEPRIPPAVVAMLQASNIALYPVLVRAVGESGVLSPGFARNGHLSPFTELQRERQASDLATSTGGKAFFDAMDLPSALRAAEEDSSGDYVLGFYPPDDALDGKYHRLVVKIANKRVEIGYRPGYIATKPPDTSELLQAPADSNGIGLAAQLLPDPGRPGFRRIHLTIDLHDLHLEPKDGRFVGSGDLLLVSPGSNSVRSGALEVNLTREELAKALESGFVLNIDRVGNQSGEIRIVVRDRYTGAAGSLRIPVPEEASR